jgi:bla regulator protein BlaR1
MRLMMRSLLADRFKFAFHMETRQVAVLALVVAKPGKTGPRLTPHPADPPCEANLPPACNSILGLPPGVPGRSRLGGRNVTIALMADMFSQRTDPGRPIIDATGLHGKFDFQIEFVPEAKTESDPDGPRFEQALPDQLGLRMESRRSPMAIMVVDHIERPSEN